jgi:tetratricopeptide (TPR) repeat protein
MVTLEVRGATMESTYTDSQGTFGFHQLLPNSYYVNINDDHYQPVRAKADIQSISLSPTVYLKLDLVPKSSAKNDATLPSKPSGANPEITDVREYTEHFPKSAVKEFRKGIRADAEGKIDEAIRHYQKAVHLAPDFYAAHNNMGSDYLGKADLSRARSEFEQVLKLNQSDAAAYFNLSNVDILMGHLVEARQLLDEGSRRQPDSALGQFLRGTLDLREGKLPEAEDALRQSIHLDPAMAQARLQLVNLFMQQGRKQDAATQLHEFLMAFPASPLAQQAKNLLHRLETADSVSQ